VVAFVVFAAGIGLAWVALRPTTRGNGRLSHLGPAAVTDTGLFAGLPVRCTAVLGTPTVQPGESPRVRFTITNEGTRAIRYGTYYSYLSVLDSSGHSLYPGGSAFPISVPPPLVDHVLRPGTSVSAAGEAEPAFEFAPVIRWPGPLVLRYTCPFVVGVEHGNQMNTAESPRLSLPLRVQTTGTAPSPSDALDRAIAASKGMFTACRPTSPTGSVVGRIDPPEGTGRPAGLQPFPARCWATVTSYRGFDSVRLAFMTPPASSLPLLPKAGFPSVPGGDEEIAYLDFVVNATDTLWADGPLSTSRFASGSAGWRFATGAWDAESGTCPGGATSMWGDGITFPLHTSC
jgi:hypothetical protein